jgi:hypothetical protein
MVDVRLLLLSYSVLATFLLERKVAKSSSEFDGQDPFSSKCPTTNSRLGEFLDRRAQGQRLCSVPCDDTKGAVFFDVSVLHT